MGATARSVLRLRHVRHRGGDDRGRHGDGSLSRAVEAALACADAAGVTAFVTIEQRHFEDARPSRPWSLVVTNPPYGARLPVARSGALMLHLGDWVLRRCGGCRAAILAPTRQL